MTLRLLARLALLFAVPSAASTGWQASETQHFIIYSKSPTARVEQLAERVESYDKLMRMATSIPEDVQAVKVRIYEVDDLADVEKALGETDSGIAGFYESNVLGPFLVTPRNTSEAGRYFTPQLVLQHEYAHHFMLQYFPAAYPRWYTEGFAELIGSSRMMDDGRIGYGMPAKHRGNEILAYWTPLQEALTKEAVRDLDVYSQGWAMAHFFTFDKQRANLFRQYLGALAAGKSMREAAKVFGDLDALNREARRYVGSGSFDYRPVKVGIDQPVIQKSRPLTAAEAALIPEVIAFRDDDLGVMKKESNRNREARLRENNLKSLRAKTARFVNDPFALYLAAEAEAASGNPAAANVAVDRLLQLQPQHVRGLARKSMLLSSAASRLQGPDRAAKAAEGRRLAVRANRLDVQDPLPMLAFYESFRLAGQKPTPAAIRGLERAVELIPRNTTVRQLLVNQLEADRRYAEAIAWLQPIANDPHDSPLRDSARQHMARLQALAKASGA